MKFIYFLLAISLLLAACSSVPQANSTPANSPSTSLNKPDPTATYLPVNTPPPLATDSTDQSASTAGDQVRIDEQGMVSVEVNPVDLANPGEVLEFEVALNTHSIDLSMDLAPLATLTTDTGKAVQAGQWDAPLGGHHVSGKLIFPITINGRPLLEGANKLTLTIKDLDTPERIFSWDLNP